VKAIRTLGPFDPFLILAVGALAAWAWNAAPGGDGDRAVVYLHGKPVAWWNLSDPTRRDTVRGDLGDLVVEHGGGQVRIVESPCPHQLCVRAGAVRALNSQIACVPSSVVVVIEGSSRKDALDAVP
jgi:hypothetical protein